MRVNLTAIVRVSIFQVKVYRSSLDIGLLWHRGIRGPLFPRPARLEFACAESR